MEAGSEGIKTASLTSQQPEIPLGELEELGGNSKRWGQSL